MVLMNHLIDASGIGLPTVRDEPPLQCSDQHCPELIYSFLTFPMEKGFAYLMSIRSTNIAA